MGHPRTVLRAGSAVALATAIAVWVGVLPGFAAPTDQLAEIQRTPVPAAECGPDSNPETGLQGEVPVEDRVSGRSGDGYSCNLRLIGQHQGAGAGIVSASYDHCAYVGSWWPTHHLTDSPGVTVLDVSDPANPVPTAVLTEPAMAGGTWESLKVNEERGLLAATGVGILEGVGTFSVYDIDTDCTRPRLLNAGPGSRVELPLPITTHEGDFSPDGRTYWASGIAPGLLHAIDIDDPSHPRVIWQGMTGVEAHGFGISADGNRMYLSNLAGITVLDIGAVQRRDPAPHVPHVGEKYWLDGQIGQHSIPVTYEGRPHTFTVDEFGSGGVKVLDVSDDADIRILDTIKLDINLPHNMDRWATSARNGGAFGYEAHYCAVDRPSDPTALACGWTESGIRVFDVRSPSDVREIAYFNPPAVTNNPESLWNSAHAMSSRIGLPVSGMFSVGRALYDGDIDIRDLTDPSIPVPATASTSDWCMSPPKFHGDQLWVTCSDNGFLALEFTDDVYPLPTR